MIRSRGEYKFVTGANVDESGSSDFNRIIVNGSIMPLRKGKAKKELRGEDIAFLMEAAIERYRIVTNSTDVSAVEFTREVVARQPQSVYEMLSGVSSRFIDASKLTEGFWSGALPHRGDYGDDDIRSLIDVDVGAIVWPRRAFNVGDEVKYEPISRLFGALKALRTLHVYGTGRYRAPGSVYSGAKIPPASERVTLESGYLQESQYWCESVNTGSVQLHYDYIVSGGGNALYSETVHPLMIGGTIDIWVLLYATYTEIIWWDDGRQETNVKNGWLLTRANAYKVYDTLNQMSVYYGMISGKVSQLLASAGITTRKWSGGMKSCTSGYTVRIDEVFPLFSFDRTNI